MPAYASTTILAFGDSLTAGYGLMADQAFPVRLEAALNAKGQDVKIINAGVSGDTTEGGKARLDWVLGDPQNKPDLVLLELGANDALRGLDPVSTKANLASMIETIKGRGIRVALLGMMAPPNLGTAFGTKYNAIYSDLAKQYGIPLYPFFLDGVASNPALNQGDGIHPNEKGVTLIVERITPFVEKLLAK